MSACKSKFSSNEVIADFESALSKLKVLHSKEHELEMDVRWAELKTGELRLRFDRATFEAMQLEWQITKRAGGGSGSLDTEKMHLEEVKKENKSLQDEILKLSEKVCKMEDEKMKLEVDMKERRAESQPEQKEKENKSLQAEILKLFDKVRKVEDEKLKLEGGLRKSEAEIQRLKLENAQLKNDKEKAEVEIKERQAKYERVKAENKTLCVENEKLIITKGVKHGNPVVFFDMEIRGVPSGRIVMELYADTSPQTAEIFRALCTGEKLIPGTDRRVGYKGANFTYLHIGYYAQGGNIIGVKNATEFNSIFRTVSHEGTSGRSTNSSGPGEVRLSVIYAKDVPHARSFIITGGLYVGYTGYVIGRVIQGMELVNANSHGFTDGVQEEGTFVIADCGQLLI